MSKPVAARMNPAVGGSPTRLPRRHGPPRLGIFELRHDLGLSRERMGRLLDVTSKSIQRWERADTLPASERVLGLVAQLTDIAALGTAIYTPDGFAEFMATPLPVFGGRTALQMIEQGQADAVAQVLAADYEGVGY